MAEWTSQIGYNYNPSYHAYAYGLMHQPGTEQNYGNLAAWCEAGVSEFNNYNPGAAQVYYAATPRAQEELPICSPEQNVFDCNYQNQGPGLVYFGESQANHLLLPGSAPASYDMSANENMRAGGDSTSDSEAHVSPDSWSFGSNREGSLPQADSATWVKKDLDDETNSRSSDASGGVSSSLVGEPKVFIDTEDNSPNNSLALQAPIPAPENPSANAANRPRGKVRAAFSEGQMDALVQRFSVQRYLTPAEMKDLADRTALSYKQVKTWFQNRRMKLRRHQKDNNWVSERYNKNSPAHGAVFNNQAQPGEARPQLTEHFNHHIREEAFKQNAPQNLAFYLAASGSSTRPAGYPAWPSSSSQVALPARPPAAGWSVSPGVNPYEFNRRAFNPASTGEHNTNHRDGDGHSSSDASQ